MSRRGISTWDCVCRTRVPKKTWTWWSIKRYIKTSRKETSKLPKWNHLTITTICLVTEFSGSSCKFFPPPSLHNSIVDYILFKPLYFSVYRIISAMTAVFLIIGTSLDVYLEKNSRNKMNGFMFDNYRYAVSSAKLQPLSEHSKIDLESGKIEFLNI